jgi:predicted ATP-binding protein involved in virulence
LHVSWQKRFISDLQKIQQIHPIDVIVATHSPQIINDRWDLVRELGADDPSPDVPEQAA